MSKNENGLQGMVKSKMKKKQVMDIEKIADY